MSIFSLSGRSPIGLDIGRRWIKAVQLGRSHGKRAVTAAASIARSQPDTPVDRSELDRLARVLSQQGFLGRKVVLSAPADHVMSGVLDMPPRESGAPYDLIAAQEFARMHRQEPGGFESNWWEIPRSARASTVGVMAVGCAHVDTQAMLEVFESCGYDVAAMDFGLCAAIRACRGQIDPSQSISAVLDMGWGTARLAMVHQGTIVFDRTLSRSGLGVLHQHVCDGLGVDPTEADCLLQRVGLHSNDGSVSTIDPEFKDVASLLRPLIVGHLDEVVHELEASFEYASHQYPDAHAHRLILVGGGGAVPGLAQRLDASLDPQTLRAEDADLLGLEGLGGMPLMAVALGLAAYDQDEG